MTAFIVLIATFGVYTIVTLIGVIWIRGAELNERSE